MVSINIYILLFLINYCVSYKILAVFPYNGRSHHIFFSSLVEELATRNHDVTVINYFPVKKMTNLHQISLQNNVSQSDTVNMEDHLMESLPTSNFLTEFFKAYYSAKAFEYIANGNCEKLVTNKDVQRIVREVKYDVVIVEQFVTDCGFALAHKLNAPTVGMTAHVLMPWTYSRLGAPNNPSFVPNHFFGSGTKPDLLNRLKSGLINSFFNIYYEHVIQRKDYDIVKRVYPETPDLESLGRNMSLILLNQYFPLTGSRLHSANIVEIGGMHIKQTSTIFDEELENFLNSAENGIIYISFGSVASNFPSRILGEIVKVIRKSNMKFVWKVDKIDDLDVPPNVLLRKWLPQSAILCHTKVLAFITHSGMLSSSEAMHCGIPVVSVPLFGDQFANAKSALENGLGVTINILTIDANVLENAIKAVLHEKYQKRAKELSKIWRDRPMSPMDTAIYWIEYVARHRGEINMKPPTVYLPLYQYLLVDVCFILRSISMIIVYVALKIVGCMLRKDKNSKDKKKNNKDNKKNN